MRVTVNGVRLFVDVEGAAFVPDGSTMRERPTVVLVHGGPGGDSSMFKPFMSDLAEHAQVIYYDHRGMGRSDAGQPEEWNLAQWGADLAGLLDALDIQNPYVIGASFGGFVAQAFATAYPERLAKLVLLCTAPRFDSALSLQMFERLGGPEAEAAARKFWAGDFDAMDDYMRLCAPCYSTTDAGRAVTAAIESRAIVRPETLNHFMKPGGEHDVVDLRPALANIRCPTLIVHGDSDPALPPALAQEMHEAIPQGLSQIEIIENCGHVWGDNPEAWKQAINAFLFGR